MFTLPGAALFSGGVFLSMIFWMMSIKSLCLDESTTRVSVFLRCTLPNTTDLGRCPSAVRQLHIAVSRMIYLSIFKRSRQLMVRINLHEQQKCYMTVVTCEGLIKNVFSSFNYRFSNSSK